MIPVLVGVGLAIGTALIATTESPNESAPASEADDTKSSKRVVDESDVPEAVRQHISAQELSQTRGGDTWSYKLGCWVSKDVARRAAHNTPEPEPPRKAVADYDKIVDAIKKLSDLYKDGILTEEEFTAKKKELLSRL